MNGVTIVKVNGELSENKINSIGPSIRPLSAIHPTPVVHNRQVYAVLIIRGFHCSKSLYKCFYYLNSGFEEPWLNRQEINRVVITPRLRLIGDSRSTGRLHTSTAHRSMTKLNNGNPLSCVFNFAFFNSLHSFNFANISLSTYVTQLAIQKSVQ